MSTSERESMPSWEVTVGSTAWAVYKKPIVGSFRHTVTSCENALHGFTKNGTLIN